MAIDLTGKVYSPGQITQSTWDIANNAVRVTSVGGSAGDASAANQVTQINLATSTLAAVQALDPGLIVQPVGTPVYKDYSSGNVTSAAYVTLIADSGATQINQINIFDSSGESLYLAIGAAASEVVKIIISPGGGFGQIPFQIPAHSRVAIKAVNTTASSGVLIVNLFG